MLYVRNDVFWEYRYIGRGDYSHKHELKQHRVNRLIERQIRDSLTTCIRVRKAAERTNAASSSRSSTIYGTIRSNLASSVRWQDRARKTSSARILELGNEQLRTFEVTRAKIINAAPS